MKPSIRRSLSGIAITLITLLAAPHAAHAQRTAHRGGGGATARPSGGAAAKPAGGGQRNQFAGTPAAAPAQNTARPTINGGSQRSPDRPSAAGTRPSSGNGVGNDRPGGGSTGGNANLGDRKPGGNNGKGDGTLGDRKPDGNGGRGDGRPGDRKPGGGGNNSNNRGDVNIGSGNTNVNINVDNSRNTTVRRNTNVHYNRPPYRYGGHSYYCYHPYHYHPYTPYYWGPVWHPWGFFVATMAVTAVAISVNNATYHYDNGVYYAPSNGGYTVVAAPVGATVQTIPSNSQTVVVNETTNNYYYGGTYYEKSDKGYTVVPPTAGCVVESLPEGGEEVKIGDVTYVKVGETYYQPIEKNGKDLYEVVDVVEGEG